ncbi:MAG: tetratricopeptide repeat protein [Halodesulfurarchaeum sp.]
MTDSDREDDREGRERPHEFSSGQGFSEPYEGFDLDPPELDVDDPSAVDPVDSRAVTDLLDDRNIAGDEVDADALLDVGIEYMAINRDEQAVETFERAARYAESDSLEAEAWVNKGIAHGELEEWDAAISAHREALHVDEDGEFAALAHTNLAYALWEHGEDEAAFQNAEDAVRADQRLPQAWYNLGYIQVERAQYEDALDALDNAIRLGFQESSVYEEKARALEGLERDEEAAEMRETATEMQEREEARLVQGE